MSAPPVRPWAAIAGCDLRPTSMAFQGLSVCGVISRWRKPADFCSCGVRYSYGAAVSCSCCMQQIDAN